MITLKCQAKSVQIKSPELLNSAILDSSLQIKRAMNGDRRTFISTPYKTTFELNFIFTNRDKILEINQFLEFAFGQIVQYTNYANRIFFVKIISEPFNTADQGRSNSVFNLRMRTVDPVTGV